MADPIFSSDNTFIRAQAGIRYFRPLWGPFVFRHRFETGLVTSRAPEGVPLFERYFLGGIFDIRGFRPRSLGPRIRVPSLAQPGTALVEFPIGGNLQVITNTELEFAIVRALALRGVVFVDVGNALNLEDQYCRLRPAGVDVAEDPCADLLPLRSLRASWGFGVRWFSPLGPLRFEWGIPFRALPGEERVVFEFTIGNTF